MESREEERDRDVLMGEERRALAGIRTPCLPAAAGFADLATREERGPEGSRRAASGARR